MREDSKDKRDGVATAQLFRATIRAQSAAAIPVRSGCNGLFDDDCVLVGEGHAAA
jgi:hypothetical protein